MSNWCWAATSVSVAGYFGRSLNHNGTILARNQSNHVFAATGSSTNNVTRSFAVVQTDFSSFYSLSTTYVFSSINMSSVQSNIDAGIPVYIRIGWSGGGGHVIVLTGYNVLNLRVLDPSTGLHTWHPSGNVYNAYLGSGTWTHTMHNFS
jgi:hypothetical protein